MDIMNYEKPTEEEIGQVLEYWQSIQKGLDVWDPALINPDPGRDVLDRVATHQAWEDAMLCQHEGGVQFSYGAPITCMGCDRPMQFLSDVQVQALKE